MSVKQDIIKGKLLNKLLFFLISIFLFPLGIQAGTITEPTELHRFTTGWVKQYRKGWNLNGIEFGWKIPEKKSLFKLSISGSSRKFISENNISGDVAVELLDSLRVEFGDIYDINKKTKKQIWLSSVAYEFYPWVKSNNWWKTNWVFYPSVGVMGQYEISVSSSSYDVEFFPLDNKDGSLSENISIPTKLSSEFNFIFPTCVNFDFWIVTLRNCALLYTQSTPSFSVSIAGGL